MVMDTFKSVTVHVWVGGKIEWTPKIRYVGGSRHEFSGVELDELCIFDFFSWYTTATGKQVFSPDVYYLVPHEELNTILRKVENDDDIRQMQKDMKNEASIKIWIEELSIFGIEDPSPRVDVNKEHQIGENDGGANSVVNAIDNPRELDGVVSDEDEQFVEDFEGPDDDDIFVERPENHSQNELRKYRAALREDRELERHATIDQDGQNLTEERRRADASLAYNDESWYTDDDSGSEEELSKKLDSDDDERPEEIHRGYVEFKDKNYPDKKQFTMQVGMLFESRGVYRQVLRDWVIRNGWDLKFSKIEASRISAKCKAGCNWYIHASTLQGCNTFQVKTIRGEHNCVAATHNSQVNYKYLGMRLVDDLRDTPQMTSEAIKRKIHREINVGPYQSFQSRLEGLK